MKRLLLLIALLCGLTGATVQAANGDVVGHIYSTDIRAYINGVEVPSYNIGGKTVVVLEDITTGVGYDDEERKLSISLEPQHIIEGSSEIAPVTGKIIGDIYETDIKTVYASYGVELPSYNIGGKTAVAIEDIAGDRDFSDIGGRYFWSEDERTINLEILYANTREALAILNDNCTDLTLTVNNDLTEGYAVFNEIYPCDRADISDYFSKVIPEFNGKRLTKIIPVTADIDGKMDIIGYSYTRNSDAFVCYYLDKLSAAAKNHQPLSVTPDDVIEHFHSVHAAYLKQRFDTDSYTFAEIEGQYITYILLINTDGTFHDYHDDLYEISGNEYHILNVRIDKENEKVYFNCGIDYVIDLKSGELKTL